MVSALQLIVFKWFYLPAFTVFDLIYSSQLYSRICIYTAFKKDTKAKVYVFSFSFKYFWLGIPCLIHVILGSMDEILLCLSILLVWYANHQDWQEGLRLCCHDISKGLEKKNSFCLFRGKWPRERIGHWDLVEIPSKMTFPHSLWYLEEVLLGNQIWRCLYNWYRSLWTGICRDGSQFGFHTVET